MPTLSSLSSIASMTNLWWQNTKILLPPPVDPVAGLPPAPLPPSSPSSPLPPLSPSNRQRRNSIASRT